MSAGDQVTKLSVEGNELSRIDQLERDVAYLRSLVMSLGRLDDATENLGSVTQGELRFKSDDDKLRMIISAINLLAEFGISAHLAGFDEYGRPQIWIDADHGSLKGAGGAFTLDAKGVLLTGSSNAFLIYDADQKAYSYIYQSDGTLILQTFKATGSQLLTNGDFGTGDSTGWTETDPYSRMSVVADGDNYVLKINPSNTHGNTYWSQSISATNGCFVILRYKNNGTEYCNICVGDGDALMWIQSMKSSEFATIVLWFENTVNEIVISADTSPSDTVYIDDVEVWQRANSGDQAIVQIDDQFVDLWGKVRINGEFAASTVPTPYSMFSAVAEFHVTTPESPFAATLISTGATTRISDETNHPGILRISNNSTANAGARIALTANAIVLQGGEVFECVFRLPQGAASRVVTLGFLDSTGTGAVVDGAWIEIDNATASAKSSKASSVHTESLGALSTNTWYRAKIVIENTLDSAVFYIYNEDGSLLYAIGIGGGTYFPTDPTGCMAKAYRTTSTNVNLLDVDYIAYYNTKTLVR